ncbi:MAG: hypothetical protein ACREP1_05355, partial [Rhodanobacteraceae bacterium]
AMFSPSPPPFPHRGEGTQNQARKVVTAPLVEESLPRTRSGVDARSAAGEGKSRKRARIASFRDAEGFRFRVFAADGEELLLSRPFDDPKAAGECTRALLAIDAVPVIEALDDSRYALAMDGDRVAASPAYADVTARDVAIAKLRAALVSLRG